MYLKDKMPYNKQGREHGRWLLHWHNGRVMFNLYYINGVELGTFSEYKYDGEIYKQSYYAR